MATPSGKTYHLGEHDVLGESVGPRAVYRDESGGEPWWAQGQRRQSGGGEFGGDLARFLGRRPVLTFVGALAVGFLVGRCVCD